MRPRKDVQKQSLQCNVITLHYESKDASGKRVSSAENVRLAAAIVGYGAVLHSSHSSRGLGLASKVFALAALREIASPVDYFVPDWHVDGKFA